MRIKIEVTQDELDDFGIYECDFPILVIDALDEQIDLPSYNVQIEIVDEVIK